MTYIKDSITSIITILSAATGLIEGTDIKKYYRGLPIRISGNYPFIYVQYNGRAFATIGTTQTYEYSMIYEIGIVDRKVDEDTAENNLMDKIELVDTNLDLDANQSLGGNVESAKFPRPHIIVRNPDFVKDTHVVWAQMLHEARVHK